MNILVSSTILSLSIILLADSIRQMRPHTRKKKRKADRSKEQPMLRAHYSGVDLTMTDLRRGGAYDR